MSYTMKALAVICLIWLATPRLWADNLARNYENYTIEALMAAIGELETEFRNNNIQTPELECENKSVNNAQELLSELEELYETPQILTEYRRELLRIQPELCLPIDKSIGALEKRFRAGASEVYCDGDTAGPGWTIIQRRNGESVDFYKALFEYKRGFGRLNDSYFIGLDRLFELTSSTPHELYIQLKNSLGESRYAKYSEFRIGGANQQYKLSKLGAYSGNAGDSLSASSHQKFVIYDAAGTDLNEAQESSLNTGWWIQWEENALKGNLNAAKSQWQTWNTTLNYVQMMIRPRRNLSNRK